MVKCEVIETFTLARFDELKNIERHNQDIRGKLFVGDRFECEEELAKYLTGDNVLKKVVVKVLEVKPIKEAKFTEVDKVEKKKTKKVAKVKQK